MTATQPQRDYLGGVVHRDEPSLKCLVSHFTTLARRYLTPDDIGDRGFSSREDGTATDMWSLDTPPTRV